MMNGVIRFSTELEAYIVSIERVEEYFHIESEVSIIVLAGEPELQNNKIQKLLLRLSSANMQL